MTFFQIIGIFIVSIAVIAFCLLRLFDQPSEKDEIEYKYGKK